MSHDFTLHLADEAATVQFAARIAKLIVPNLTICLQGDLGAGKTTLVRGILQVLGYVGKVKSPTYTILETYDINIENGLKLTINHFDLYRFNDEEEWEAAGFRDAFNAQSVSFIEWPEKAQSCLPQADLILMLAISQTAGRQLTINAISPKGEQLITALRKNV